MQNVPVTQITPAMRQAARDRATRILAAKRPTYQYVSLNGAVLQRLERLIARTSMKRLPMFYTVWVEGAEIVLPDGSRETIEGGYKWTRAEPAINEFLDYIALNYCARFGFLATFCIVYKDDLRDKHGNIIGLKGQPGEAFFKLAEDVGLLADQHPQSRETLLNDHRDVGFRHNW